MNEQENKTKVAVESEFNKLNVSNKDFKSVNTDHKNCSYCNKPFTEELWCKECDPRKMIEEWTSGNPDIDKFIKDTIYNARKGGIFLEWVPFDRFTDIEQIGEGGFSKVYSATWIDGKSKYIKQTNGNWKTSDFKPMKVALKRLNRSQNISEEHLNKVLYI